MREGHTAADIMVKGLCACMTRSGKIYGKKGMFLDSILWSATAFQMGLASISSAPETEQPQSASTVVLAVMDGPWTIGKDIAAAVLRANRGTGDIRYDATLPEPEWATSGASQTSLNRLR